MTSSKTETYTISKKMLEQIESLRDTERTPPRQFTEEQDAIIKNFYMKKNKKDLAKLLGCCEGTMRRRYKDLTRDKTK